MSPGACWGAGEGVSRGAAPSLPPFSCYISCSHGPVVPEDAQVTSRSGPESTIPQPWSLFPLPGGGIPGGEEASVVSRSACPAPSESPNPPGFSHRALLSFHHQLHAHRAMLRRGGWTAGPEHTLRLSCSPCWVPIGGAIWGPHRRGCSRPVPGWAKQLVPKTLTSSVKMTKTGESERRTEVCSPDPCPQEGRSHALAPPSNPFQSLPENPTGST